VNVDLPQAAQNKGRGRGAAGRGGAKAGLGQKMGEQIFFFQNSQKIFYSTKCLLAILSQIIYNNKISESYSFYRKTQPTEECK